ncbi:hypothetical protein CRUP_037403, partial [Coryphaenoides rupestris]
PPCQFPRTWPHGSPDQTRALVARLTHQGQDLSHHYQVQKLLVQHGSPSDSQPADGEDLQVAPRMTLGAMERAAADLRRDAIRAKQGETS